MGSPMRMWPLSLQNRLRKETSICGEVIHDCVQEWTITNPEEAIRLVYEIENAKTKKHS